MHAKIAMGCNHLDHIIGFMLQCYQSFDLGTLLHVAVSITQNARYSKLCTTHLLMNFMTFSRYHMKQLTQHIRYLTNAPATPALA